jgi:23S rRNA pseudouridine2605 synthase
MKERVQKILARAGHGSRRSVEELIKAGRVTVNGRRIAIGDQADLDADVVELDGFPVRPMEQFVYLAMHKPAGYVTTASDPQRRKTGMELLPEGLPPHVLPIGRLDRDTDGLLLFSNDGEFAHRLSHPRYEVEKEYHALVEGRPAARTLAELEHGVMIDDRKTSPAQVEIAGPPPGWQPRDAHTWLRLVVHEGRKRQVRRMCAAVGHPVRALVRTRIDGVLLGKLERGATREVSARELSSLRTSVGLDETARSG